MPKFGPVPPTWIKHHTASVNPVLSSQFTYRICGVFAIIHITRFFLVGRELKVGRGVRWETQNIKIKNIWLLYGLEIQF